MSKGRCGATGRYGQCIFFPDHSDAPSGGEWHDNGTESWPVEAGDLLTDFERGVLAERARCRAIVVRLFERDWHGGEALRLIDGAP